MASSKCPSCDHHSFELQEVAPRSSRYKMYAIQCTNCGSVVSVMEYESNNGLLYEQANAIKELQHGQEVINQNLATIINFMNKKK